MLCNRANIASSSFFKKTYPFICIEFFGCKKRDKILIAKVFLFSKCFNVVRIFRLIFYIHIARIPLIKSSRNRIKPPVRKNAKSLFSKPSRNFPLCQAFPSIFECALLNCAVDVCKCFFVIKHKIPL